MSDKDNIRRQLLLSYLSLAALFLGLSRWSLLRSTTINQVGRLLQQLPQRCRLSLFGIWKNYSAYQNSGLMEATSTLRGKGLFDRIDTILSLTVSRSIAYSHQSVDWL
jgi:hypothetical protein